MFVENDNKNCTDMRTKQLRSAATSVRDDLNHRTQAQAHSLRFVSRLSETALNIYERRRRQQISDARCAGPDMVYNYPPKASSHPERYAPWSWGTMINASTFVGNDATYPRYAPTRWHLFARWLPEIKMFLRCMQWRPRYGLMSRISQRPLM